MHNDAAPMEIRLLYFPISTSFWLREKQFHYVFIQVTAVYNPVQVAERLQKCNACHFNNSLRYRVYVSGHPDAPQIRS